MNHYGYDSFAGPSLNLRPEELDRLDASQIEPSERPSYLQELDKFRRMEGSIETTLKEIDRRLNKCDEPILDHHHQRPTSSLAFYQNNFNTSPNVDYRPPLDAFTPPSSSNQPFDPTTKNLPTLSLIDKYPQKSEQSAHATGNAEAAYRTQLYNLRTEVEQMVKQNQRVLEIKDQMERELQAELEQTKRELKREREGRENDRQKSQRTIKELRERIRDLERRISGPSRRLRSVSFADYDDEYEEYGNGMTMNRGEYERRLNDMQREHDAKIASLVRHFEKEKASALEIIKSKFRAEVSLLVPKIKDQYQKALSSKLQSWRESFAAQCREQYEERARRMREDHAMERRVWQRQTRDQLDLQRDELVKKLKARYELRILDIKNECERRILQRLRDSKHSDYYCDHSFSDESFVS